jgi:predicted nucleic acid-binding protein
VGLIDDVGPGPIGLDTAIFIYLIDEHPQFLPIVLPLFEQADAGRRELVTSALTLLEVLVVPYRARKVQVAESYERLLTTSRGIRIVDLTRVQLRSAAQLRAATRMKTPDAIQLTAAVSAGCRVFVTNDRRLPEVPGIQVRQLSSYVAR